MSKEVRFYVDSAGTYLGAWNSDPPEGAIAVPAPDTDGGQIWLFPGWSESSLAKTQIEAAWRAAEMPIARENVTAIEFGDDSIPGTAAQWKAYWLALRAWTEGAEGYPDATHRPVQPT
ncbi:hypothetical protein [Pseudomonas sp. CF161]|uniref:hypothetical protein n=1 Tax=Pseudomonas sp. CF161 TaxID=911241 RepID=UPI0012EC4B44|nr:hypothetical protein [Pseudomonas sp. CF161]